MRCVVKTPTLLVACALVVACASTPPSATPEPETGSMAPTAPATPHAGFEQRQRDRALGLKRQGRLADAALAWEVLTVLRPDVADYRERLAEVQREIDAAVAERLPLASQAARRGELDSAMQRYLGVLALDPDHAVAADALRALERERVKRNYLGKYTRFTLTRRAISDGEMKVALKLEDRNEIEHASMLAGQGDFDDAIALLEQRVSANPRENATRQLLADIYFQKVQAQPGLDKAAAIRLLERSVRLDPSHAGAKARLRQLKSADVASRPAPAGAPTPARVASAPAR
jgi:tetratricopeptide (TPR) repeat protein